MTANTGNNNNAVAVVPPASGGEQQPTAQAPVVEQPVIEQPVVQEPVNECDRSYPDFCLAPSWVIGDLDCGDISYRRFTVYAPDSHGFDSDGDMVGCESG